MIYVGIRIEKVNLVYCSTTGQAIVPEHVFHTLESLVKVNDYVKANPFPETELYNAKDLLCDCTSSSAWTLGDYVTEEQKDYIIELINVFLS